MTIDNPSISYFAQPLKQSKQKGERTRLGSTAPWPYGLICHALDREDGGSNLGEAYFFWTKRLKKETITTRRLTAIIIQPMRGTHTHTHQIG